MVPLSRWGRHVSSKLIQNPPSNADRIGQHPGFSFTCNESRITFCILRVVGSCCVCGPSVCSALLGVSATLEDTVAAWEIPAAAVVRPARRRLKRPSLLALAALMRGLRETSHGVTTDVESAASSFSNPTFIATLIVPGSLGSFRHLGMYTMDVSAASSASTWSASTSSHRGSWTSGKLCKILQLLLPLPSVMLLLRLHAVETVSQELSEDSSCKICGCSFCSCFCCCCCCCCCGCCCCCCC